MLTDFDQPIDYIAILRRRKGIAVAGGALVALLGLLVAIFWPPVYRSQATILIEESEIPGEMVKSTISSFADERLQVIQQRVMTTQNLLRIIDDLGLYRKARAEQPTTSVVEAMRKRIKLGMVNVDISDRDSGRSSRATIAFTISFDDSSPEIAQKVASELVALYLSENIQSRQQQITGTRTFLSQESQRLYAEVVDLEKKIADFKSKHAGSLPEQELVNIQIRDRAQSDLLSVREQIQDAEQRKILLEGQLAQLSATDARASRLDSLNRRLDATKRALQASQDERESLEPLIPKGFVPVNRIRQLDRTIASLEADLASIASEITIETSALDQSQIQLQAQIDAAASEIDSLNAQSQALEAKIAELERQLLETPEVERAYLDLKRGYDAALAKFEEMSRKENEAQLAQSIEVENRGERFSVIDPPTVPERPIKPNRLLIFLAGLVFAVPAGAGGGILLETLQGKVVGPRGLSSIFGEDPLVVVPYIHERRASSIRQWLPAILRGQFPPNIVH